MIVGYARVSAQHQDTALQLDAFQRAGVERVYEEKVSAVARQRPELQKLLQEVQAGDVVVVYKVDRLARSIVDLKRIVETLGGLGVEFRSLTQPFDTSSSMGKLVFSLLGVLAEFERDMILERCDAGRKAAMARGVRFGRRRVVEVEVALQLVDGEGLTHAQAAARLGVHPSSVSRALAIARGTLPSSRRRSFD
ncbi:MAG: recombinase family protein [Aquabacterium sp.]|jgi:DNA invertase Pin-like site-specific DNA recombinase|nr:MAG: recombinase family protein [Aquabacterium sp.]